MSKCQETKNKIIKNKQDPMRPVLIYHANCPDGFGARFAFQEKYGSEIEYIALSHKSERFKGLNIERFRGRKVWMVDTALKREDAIELNNIAESFLILDHHISAEKNLRGLNFAKFDMNHSGAILAWNYCFPDRNPPKLLEYIENRDLWKFDLYKSKELLTAIDSYKRNYKVWKKLSEKIETEKGFDQLVSEGYSILRYNQTLMNIILENVYYTEIKGYRVPIINTPFFRSEILNDLALDNPFSAGYHYDGNMFIFSLRSTDSGVDVSEIASKFDGGGGHKKASGFSIRSLEELK